MSPRTGPRDGRRLTTVPRVVAAAARRRPHACSPVPDPPPDGRDPGHAGAGREHGGRLLLGRSGRHAEGLPRRLAQRRSQQGRLRPAPTAARSPRPTWSTQLHALSGDLAKQSLVLTPVGKPSHQRRHRVQHDQAGLDAARRRAVVVPEHGPAHQAGRQGLAGGLGAGDRAERPGRPATSCGSAGLPAKRAAILDAAGQPIVTARDVVTIGVTPAEDHESGTTAEGPDDRIQQDRLHASTCPTSRTGSQHAEAGRLHRPDHFAPRRLRQDPRLASARCPARSSARSSAASHRPEPSPGPCSARPTRPPARTSTPTAARSPRATSSGTAACRAGTTRRCAARPASPW